MKITNHFIERYCERILNIPEKEIKNYVAQNHDRINQEIGKLIDESTCIYRGHMNSKRPNAFHVNRDIMIICSYESKEAVTLYPIEFPYPTRVRKVLIKSIVQEIQAKQKIMDRMGAGAEQKGRQLRRGIDGLDKELAILRSKINQLEEKKKVLKRRLWEVKSGPDQVSKEIQMLVSQLCGRNQEVQTRTEANG